MKGQSAILSATILEILIAVVMCAIPNDRDDDSHCKPRHVLGHYECSDKCPTNTQGRCMKFRGKWQCMCGFTNDDKRLVPASEMRLINKVCNDLVQDNQGCTKLCPSTFRYGDCVVIDGMWQCVCSQTDYEENEKYTLREARKINKVCRSTRQSHSGCSNLCPDRFKKGYCRKIEGRGWGCRCASDDDKRPMLYTINKARSIINVCNEAVQDDDGCKQYCPPTFAYGRCIKPVGVENYNCFCSQTHARDELYPLSDAKHIHKSCNSLRHLGSECTKHCPNQLVGRCFYISLTDRMWGCGCSTSVDETNWYTVKQARDMFEACNSQTVDNAGCTALCPNGFKNGECKYRSGIWECECEGQSVENDKWFTLKEALTLSKEANA